MAILTQLETDGYVLVGTGAVQVQLKTSGSVLNIIHNAVAPLSTDEPEFAVTSRDGIVQTLGVDDCYIKVMRTSNDDAAIKFSVVAI